MNLTLDPMSPFGLGEQIVGQIRARILGGELAPGDPLPSARALAERLNVHANTVAAAYRTLVASGHLVQRRRAGTRVSDDPPRPAEALLAARLTAPLAAALRGLGLDGGEAAALLAAQVAGAGGGGRLRLGALARTPLAADALAGRARALLGPDVEVDGVVPDGYDSTRYHLTLLDPELTRTLERGLRAEAAPTPLADYQHYSPDFPAGAD
jgi:DNA-binding transcriptional regulator YhcF (GntR family)